MPFYEYQCKQCGVFEMLRNMSDPDLSTCPTCGGEIKKLISLPIEHVVAHRTVNQYSDVKRARYWRDANGVRHKVTAADGFSNSATVARQTDPPSVVEARKLKYKEQDKQRRLKLQEQIAKAKAEAMRKQIGK